MNLKIFNVTILALTLYGCASSSTNSVKAPPSSAVSLNDAQIRTALIGNKLINVSKPSSLSFNADGSEIFKTSGAEPIKEFWRVKDGVMCIESTGYPTDCFRVKADKNDHWFVKPDSGEPLYQYTLTPQ